MKLKIVFENKAGFRSVLKDVALWRLLNDYTRACFADLPGVGGRFKFYLDGVEVEPPPSMVQP